MLGGEVIGGEGTSGGGRVLLLDRGSPVVEAGDMDRFVLDTKDPLGGDEATRRWLGIADRISTMGELEGVGVVRLLSSSSTSLLISASFASRSSFSFCWWSTGTIVFVLLTEDVESQLASVGAWPDEAREIDGLTGVGGGAGAGAMTAITRSSICRGGSGLLLKLTLNRLSVV